MWTVEIRQYDGFKLIKTLGPYATYRAADRADDGVNRNLDTYNFYTVIQPVDQNGNGTRIPEQASELRRLLDENDAQPIEK
jgi:hypothetical protein